VPRLKRTLVDQICAGTGGPCTYAGRDMKTAHAGMGVTNADFDALVGDLVKTLDKFKVPEKEKGELLGILGPMRPSIVGQEGLVRSAPDRATRPGRNGARKTRRINCLNRPNALKYRA